MFFTIFFAYLEKYKSLLKPQVEGLEFKKTFDRNENFQLGSPENNAIIYQTKQIRVLDFSQKYRIKRNSDSQKKSGSMRKRKRKKRKKNKKQKKKKRKPYYGK